MAKALGISTQADGDTRAASDAAERTADGDTRYSYNIALGETGSTRNAGRIWTDKSVSTEDVVFTGSGNTGSTTVKKDADEDFLVTYSALATTQEITSLPKVPVDVVFVLDFSASMTWRADSTEADSKESSRIYAMVKSLNDAIRSLANDNPENRIAIVTFNRDVTTLLPLTRLDDSRVASITESEGDYLTLGTYKLEYDDGGKPTGDADSTVECNINHNEASTASVTNIQLGLNTGMRILADANDTTFTYEGDGKTYSRIPNVVLMSDGAPTTVAEPTGAWYSENLRSSDFWGDNNHAWSANGLLPMLTAQLYKERITDHYASASDPLANAGQAQASMYTIGFGINQQNKNMVALANMVLNPADNWDASKLNVNNPAWGSTSSSYDQEGFEQVGLIIDAWNEYMQGKRPSVTYVTNSDRNKATLQVSHPLDDMDLQAGAPTYVDEYFPAEDASDLNDAFQQITNAITESAKAPTEIEGGNPAESGYITYVDTLGDYMEVGSVKKLIWAGHSFELKNDGKQLYSGDTSFLPNVDDNKEITKYTFSGEIISPVYGTHDASEIDIFAYTNTNGRAVLVVRIPATAIPLRVEYVGVNSDGSVSDDQTYTRTVDAYPLRLVYSVNLNDDVVNADGTLNTDVVSNDYIQAHTEGGAVEFFTNYFSGQVEDNGNGKESVGDTYVEYTPASDNPFYYVQEDIPLYMDAACTEPATEFSSNDTYYIKT